MLFEKIFQRDDKSFLLLYYLFLSAVLYLSSVLAYFIRNKTLELSEIYFKGTIYILLIFLILSFFNFKENRYIKGTVQWLRLEFLLLIQTFVIVILLTVMLKTTDDYSRIWLFTYMGISLTLFLLSKVLFDLIYSKLISSNAIQRNILLIGDTEGCQNIIQKFPKKISNSVIKCLIAIDQLDKKDLNFYGIPSFSLKENFGQILNHHAIGQVWIISSSKTQSYIESLIDKFLNFSVDCRLIQPESKFKFIEGLDSEAGFDFYNISFSPFFGTSFLIKSIFDKIFSLLALILMSPIILIFSILILIEDGFPIFFSQKRTGWDGSSFDILKLRSIKNMKNNNETLQVKAGDSRLLKVGKIIRRLSIDELPQFINVLKGDMAIVGPRPHMIDHTKYYSNDIKNFMQRHKCLPGITGWAQVNGSRGPTDSEGAMNKRFQHDLYYIKNWNLMLDVYILIRTIFVVLFQRVD
ncbi:exopolysaccharide biosynthesis polyprenyl glycosylphosphotransferase [Candidatus Pelagibacter sp. Uisw_137]|uniref:exopolysaccharide biosynthesis polyprenyl glycosylphosphotransferase n=1 Tax=Candidatus Pelagibacter sp. Uisw_137 TaxID=3230992 RepID=UPI0039E95B4E